MNRRFTSCIVFLLTTFLSFGAPIDKQKAQQLAWTFLQQQGLAPQMSETRAGMQNKLTEVLAKPAYYVFDIGTDKGYVIVSSDDRTAPVLGYTDQGSFDLDNLPIGLQELLASYECEWAQLDHLTSSTAYTKTSSNRTEIESLVPTRWNQMEPYNLLAPMDGSEQSVTGCVATAMAQLMYYHQWPQSPTEPIAGYTTTSKKIEVDVLPSTTFDWNSMKLSYNGGEEDAANRAVATLMRYAGQSVKMDFTSNSSGAITARAVAALTEKFGYARDMHFINRSSYGYEAWNDLIYNELKNKRPVCYSATNEYGNGHAFVCDGYREGDYFHINWGWGGMSDGFYRLSILLPGQAGTGGSTGSYSRRQSAIIGIQPSDGTEQYPQILSALSIEITPQTVERRKGWLPDFYLTFTNPYGAAINAAVGAALFDGERMVEIVNYEETTKYEPLIYSIRLPFYYSEIDASVPVGTYQLHPVYSLDNGKSWQRFPEKVYATIELTATTISVLSQDPILEVKEAKLTGSLEPNTMLQITLQMDNTGGECNEEWRAYLNDNLSGITGAFVGANDSNDISFYIRTPEVGTYTLAIKRPDGTTIYKKEIEIALSDLKEMPTAVLNLNLDKNGNLPNLCCSGSITVTNSEPVAYRNGINIWLLKVKKGTSKGYVVDDLFINDEIPANSTRDITFSFSQLDAGEQYCVGAIASLNGEVAYIAMSYFHEAVATTDGIVANTADKVEAYPVYTLQGIKVANSNQNLSRLPKGIYIVNGKKVMVN